MGVERIEQMNNDRALFIELLKKGFKGEQYARLNKGGSTFAMLTMVAGFITNITLDYQFVWVCIKNSF